MQSSFIKLLDLSDLKDLIPLFDAYRIFYRQVSDPATAEKFISERITHKEAMVYGYFIQSRLVGFTLLYPLFSSVRMKPFYLLNDLYVLPEFRNAHIGSALLQYCQAKAKAEQQVGIMLETEKTNEVGNHLYPSLGFEQVSSSNFYFWETK